MHEWGREGQNIMMFHAASAVEGYMPTPKCLHPHLIGQWQVTWWILMSVVQWHVFLPGRRAVQALWHGEELHASCEKEKIIWNNNEIDHRHFSFFTEKKINDLINITQSVRGHNRSSPQEMWFQFTSSCPTLFCAVTLLYLNTYNILSMRQHPNYSQHLHLANEQVERILLSSCADFLSDSYSMFNYDKQRVCGQADLWESKYRISNIGSCTSEGVSP